VFDRLLAARSLDGALRDVVLPVLHEVGERWACGDVTVAQEHYATELLAGRLRGLAREWDDGLGPRAVLACPPGERHDIGLLCCGLALHRRGWRVTYLGPDTPVEALGSTVSAVGPSLAVIGVLQSETLHAAAPDLAELADEVAIAVGGSGATPDLAAAARAHHLDTDPVTAAGDLSRGRS
jgi:methanogenic corrinoid protein MtbC1